MEKEISILKRVIEWSMSEDSGLSSMAICAHMVGVTFEDGISDNYPRDAGDLGRCFRLLKRIPEWHSRIPEMAQYGPVWASIAEQWDDLFETMKEESGIDFSKQRKAQKTASALFKAISIGTASLGN